MHTDKHRWEFEKTFAEKGVSQREMMLFLSVCICVHLWLGGLAFAGQATPSVDSAVDVAAQDLEKAKNETQQLKDVWDKARLEVTLYDQRAKRAYQKWAKAAKAAKEQARVQKERTSMELELAIEKRKLAFNEWQAAQLRQAASEDRVKALDQEKDSAAIRDKIKKLEDKISSQGTGRSSQ